MTTGSDRLASRQRGGRAGKWRRKAQQSEEWRVRGSEEQRERARRGADRLAWRESAPVSCSADTERRGGRGAMKQKEGGRRGIKATGEKGKKQQENHREKQ